MLVDAVSRAFRPRRGKTTVALDAVSLTVRAGEWVSILGPNGSGKSTLLKIVVGLEHADSGCATVFASDAGAPSARAAIGVVFQSNSLDGLLTVRENLALAARVAGVHGPKLRERVASVAESMRLTDRLDDRVSTLSGGLKRRADVARALVSSPRVLILDEATTGLDPTARRELLGMLDQHRAANSGFTIIASTHLFDEAERGERVVMMDRGRIVLDQRTVDLAETMNERRLVVRAGANAEHAAGELARLGINVERTPRGELAASVTPGSASARAAVQSLASLGCDFALTSPTLADIYERETGRTLLGDGGGTP